MHSKCGVFVFQSLCTSTPANICTPPWERHGASMRTFGNMCWHAACQCAHTGVRYAQHAAAATASADDLRQRRHKLVQHTVESLINIWTAGSAHEELLCGSWTAPAFIWPCSWLRYLPALHAAHKRMLHEGEAEYIASCTTEREQAHSRTRAARKCIACHQLDLRIMLRSMLHRHDATCSIHVTVNEGGSNETLLPAAPYKAQLMIMSRVHR